MQNEYAPLNCFKYLKDKLSLIDFCLILANFAAVIATFPIIFSSVETSDIFLALSLAPETWILCLMLPLLAIFRLKLIVGPSKAKSVNSKITLISLGSQIILFFFPAGIILSEIFRIHYLKIFFSYTALQSLTKVMFEKIYSLGQLFFLSIFGLWFFQHDILINFDLQFLNSSAMLLGILISFFCFIIISILINKRFGLVIRFFEFSLACFLGHVIFLGGYGIVIIRYGFDSFFLASVLSGCAALLAVIPINMFNFGVREVSLIMMFESLGFKLDNNAVIGFSLMQSISVLIICSVAALGWYGVRLLGKSKRV